MFYEQLGIKLKWLFRCFKSFILIHSNLNNRSRKKYLINLLKWTSPVHLERQPPKYTGQGHKYICYIDPKYVFKDISAWVIYRAFSLFCFVFFLALHFFLILCLLLPIYNFYSVCCRSLHPISEMQFQSLLSGSLFWNWSAKGFYIGII